MANEIKDVQGLVDKRNLNIDKVGVNNVAFATMIDVGFGVMPFQGRASVLAFLSKNEKGTHMSRMVRAVNKMCEDQFELLRAENILREVKDSLSTKDVELELEANLVRRKKSPITGNYGFEEFKFSLYMHVEDQSITRHATVSFVGTSLCPASKTNSAEGAHNQRSEVKIKFPVKDLTQVASYMNDAEDNFSCAVYPVLKLEDEAFITQYAYDNPKFVEDIVRDIAARFNSKEMEFKCIECLNLESIHTHNAYARISNE